MSQKLPTDPSTDGSNVDLVTANDPPPMVVMDGSASQHVSPSTVSPGSSLGMFTKP